MSDGKVTCGICPHGCALSPGQYGLCRARKNEDRAIVCVNYSLVTSIALDPIEKKPLRRFFPGSSILSVGSFGCNLRCSFCQNHEISMADGAHSQYVSVSPYELIQKAVSLRPQGNIGIAFTYNEPLIGYEYVRDCAMHAAMHAKEYDLKIVLVTNGFICEEPLRELLPYVDAMNIDLKSFTDAFYQSVGGARKDVLRTIEIASKHCHVEVTTLVIPGENDTEEEMRALSQWLCGINREIPLHISRFFPRYRMQDRSPTPIETVRRLADVARECLDYVYAGNI